MCYYLNELCKTGSFILYNFAMSKGKNIKRP